MAMKCFCRHHQLRIFRRNFFHVSVKTCERRFFQLVIILLIAAVFFAFGRLLEETKETCSVPTDLEEIQVKPYTPLQFSHRWSLTNLIGLFYRELREIHASCSVSAEFGAPVHGWHLCLASAYYISNPCVVYSISREPSWLAEKDIAKLYGCRVRIFNPTLKSEDGMLATNVWHYRYKLSEKNLNKDVSSGLLPFLRLHGDHLSDVDILSVYLDQNQWSLLDAAIKEGGLHRVKQLIVKTYGIHPGRKKIQRMSLFHYLQVLESLNRLGFRRWHTDGMISADGIGYTHRLFFININFLMPESCRPRMDFDD